MRRTIACLVFVLVMLAAAAADAGNTGMIGKRVDAAYPIFINGQELDGDVISIEGTSYIPVRVAAEAFGYQTNFVNKMVVLSPKQTTSPPLSVKVRFDGIATKTDPGAKFNVKYIDGEWYVELGAFGVYAGYNGTQGTITIPGCSQLVVPVYQYYEPGVDGFWDGVIYIKASALGMKATLDGGSMEIAPAA